MPVWDWLNGIFRSSGTTTSYVRYLEFYDGFIYVQRQFRSYTLERGQIPWKPISSSRRSPLMRILNIIIKSAWWVVSTQRRVFCLFLNPSRINRFRVFVEYKSRSWYIENQFKFISLCVLKYDIWYEVIWFVSIDLIENWVETSHGDLMMIFSILMSGKRLDDDIGFQGIWPLFNVYETDVERICNHRRTLDTGRTK